MREFKKGKLNIGGSKKKAEQVFYASKNKGKIKNVDKKRKKK